MSTEFIPRERADMRTPCLELNRIQGLACPHASKTVFFNADTSHNSRIFRKLSFSLSLVSALLVGHVTPANATQLPYIPKIQHLQPTIYEWQPLNIQPGEIQTDYAPLKWDANKQDFVQEPVKDIHDELPPLKLITPDEGVQEIYRGPVEFVGTVDFIPTKEMKFKDRHPKIYKVFRKGRFVCIMFLPYLSATSMVCQIVVPFLL